jgi:hypothetical protein
MQNTRSIKELLRAGGKRLGGFTAQARERSVVLEKVRAALPAPLAQRVVSAGFEGGTLRLGVAGAPWASRLRYAAETLRDKLGTSMGLTVQSVRIRVVPPRPAASPAYAAAPPTKVAPPRI